MYKSASRNGVFLSVGSPPSTSKPSSSSIAQIASMNWFSCGAPGQEMARREVNSSVPIIFSACNADFTPSSCGASFEYPHSSAKNRRHSNFSSTRSCFCTLCAYACDQRRIASIISRQPTVQKLPQWPKTSSLCPHSLICRKCLAACSRRLIS